jgi:hypothetical protein
MSGTSRPGRRRGKIKSAGHARLALGPDGSTVDFGNFFGEANLCGDKGSIFCVSECFWGNFDITKKLIFIKKLTGI